MTVRWTNGRDRKAMREKGERRQRHEGVKNIGEENVLT
jgi:hypothetical protein